MKLGDRIKAVRKANHLTQQNFADRIGSKRNTLATYEMGRTMPSAAVVSLICREFHINETWLRTGEGEMQAPFTKDEELAVMVEKLLSNESSEFKKRFISILAELKTKEWQVLEKYARQLLQEQIPSAQSFKDPLPKQDSLPVTQLSVKELQEIDKETALFRQYKILETTRMSTSRSSVMPQNEHTTTLSNSPSLEYHTPEEVSLDPMIEARVAEFRAREYAKEKTRRMCTTSPDTNTFSANKKDRPKTERF